MSPTWRLPPAGRRDTRVTGFIALTKARPSRRREPSGKAHQSSSLTDQQSMDVNTTASPSRVMASSLMSSGDGHAATAADQTNNNQLTNRIPMTRKKSNLKNALECEYDAVFGSRHHHVMYSPEAVARDERPRSCDAWRDDRPQRSHEEIMRIVQQRNQTN